MYGLIDIRGHNVLPCEYSSLAGPSLGLLKFRCKEGDKDGYVDCTGTIIIEPQFDNAGEFSKSGLAWIMETRGTIDYYGFINRAGECVVPAVHAGVSDPREGLFQFRSYDHDKLLGYMDLGGKVIVTPRYATASHFSCGLAAVTFPGNDEEAFFVDRTGRHVLGPIRGLEVTEPFDENGVARVYDEATDQALFINTLGQIMLKDSPGVSINYFREGLAEAYDNETKLCGFVDITGQWAVPSKYNGALGFRDGYAQVWRSGAKSVWQGALRGIIDRAGREVVPLAYEILHRHSCQRVGFVQRFPDGGFRSGYLSLADGRIVIPPRFRGVCPFQEGFAVVGPTI